MERRWQLKQISAAVWILATEGERGTLYQPLHLFSLSLFGSLHHLHFHVSFPLLFSPPPPLHPSFFPLLHLLWTWGTQRLLAARQPSAAEV